MKYKQLNQEWLRKAFMLFFSAFLLPAALFAQIKVSGTVVDENDDPMIGVSVIEEGTNTGTATDVDGNFYLTVKNANSMLRFTYIGYEPYEAKVGKRINFNIQMSPKTGTLDEVVVVGFGVQKKANLTGAVSTVSGK